MTDQPNDPATVDHAARAADLERELAETRSTGDARLLRAELKTEALRAGIIDLEGLKLFDTSGLKLAADGTLPDAAEIMAGMKRDKPWLFGKSNTSYAAPPPPPEPAKQRKATEMSHKEWQAARAQLLKQR
jgi:hypothetical protein